MNVDGIDGLIGRFVKQFQLEIAVAGALVEFSMLFQSKLPRIIRTKKKSITTWLGAGVMSPVALYAKILFEGLFQFLGHFLEKDDGGFLFLFPLIDMRENTG